MVANERSAPPRVLITGANRGIGLALTRLFASNGWQVDASSRDPARAQALQALAASSSGKVLVRRVDVSDHASIDALARAIDGAPIDLLLNNAGVMDGAEGSDRARTDQQFGKLDFDAWMQVMRINLMGPARMTEVFADNVAHSTRKTIAILSSIRGSVASIGASGPSGPYHYCTSKTAVNMLMRNICAELGPRGITAVSLHPGWARTDMGGAGAPVAVEDSARGLFNILNGLTPTQAGRFLTWEGEELPW